MERSMERSTESLDGMCDGAFDGVTRWSLRRNVRWNDLSNLPLPVVTHIGRSALERRHGTATGYSVALN